MTCIEKFTFARTFADAVEAMPGDVAAPPPPAPPAVYGEADLAAAREAARSDGLAEGRASARAEAHAALEQRVADTLERLAGRIDRAIAEREEIARASDRGAVALVAVALRKALPALHRNFAVAEIEAMTSELAARMADVPALTVAVHPALVAAIGERLIALDRTGGRNERFRVIAEPGLAEGDCTVAWSGGGGERRLAALLAGIDDIVTTLTGAPPPPVDAQGSGSMEHNG